MLKINVKARTELQAKKQALYSAYKTINETQKSYVKIQAKWKKTDSNDIGKAKIIVFTDNLKDVPNLNLEDCFVFWEFLRKLQTIKD
jgi:effector-binding domain-containing protein